MAVGLHHCERNHDDRRHLRNCQPIEPIIRVSLRVAVTKGKFDGGKQRLLRRTPRQQVKARVFMNSDRKPLEWKMDKLNAEIWCGTKKRQTPWACPLDRSVHLPHQKVVSGICFL